MTSPLGPLLDHLAEVLPPPTADEIARYHRRHATAHDRGYCDCGDRPDLHQPITTPEVSDHA